MKSNNYQSGKSRRNFIKNSAVTVAAFTIVPRYVMGGSGFIAPSDKLNIACIGVGGKGRVDLDGVSSENIIALCDVDQQRASEDGVKLKNAYVSFPQARRYLDFREMLDKENDLDAVTISTPDHTHAVITMEAMKKGKHVFTQKPLTHTIDESRKVVDFAKKAGLATQMGNQAHAKEGPRIVNELIWQGAIGTVKEVHCWTDRPIWPQGLENRPAGSPPVPSTLNWELWLGPSPYRPYNPAYVPFNWRGWWDFGTGALGDMGCHILDYPFWALKLGSPTSVEAYSTPVYKETAPLASIVNYKFKSGLDGNVIDLTWYDGGLKPTLPEGLQNTGLWGNIGVVMFKGDEGILVYGHHRPKPILLVKGKEIDYGEPKQMIPRSPGHYIEWTNEIRGSMERAMSNFDYAGPLNEAVLLGNIAIRTGKKLIWDSENMNFSNMPEANQYLKNDYRNGWSL